MNREFWQGRSVFVTGHTGFKGSWLCLWLQSLGAQVHGYATEPPTTPNMFNLARIGADLASHTIGDVRDAESLTTAVTRAAPEVVLHLAAQPLVRRSYADPLETYAVNVLGTVHLLQAVRNCGSVRAVVNVTTDKCYENREWIWAYRENESLGGRDPYSSSKACAELVTAAYRASFFERTGVCLASARAGNVIGGGDWADDRLLPDFFRAVANGRPVEIRFPEATRPWQHVLEPLSGYLRLAELLYTNGERYASAWNFGPTEDAARSVRWILDYLCERVPNASWKHLKGEKLHEAGMLSLDSARAAKELSWVRRWNLEQALDVTVTWHQGWRGGRDMRVLSLQQIAAYVSEKETDESK